VCGGVGFYFVFFELPATIITDKEEGYSRIQVCKNNYVYCLLERGEFVNIARGRK